MENKKIYFYFRDEEYYGCRYDWEEADADEMLGESDEFPSLKTKDARLYTLSCVEYFIDELSEFIKPSILFDFIKTLKDVNTGEELYNRLQENIGYANDLVHSVHLRGDVEGSSELNDYIFGRYEPYGPADECHLAPFGEGKLLMKWLLPHDEFIVFFKDKLKRNKKMYATAYHGKDMKNKVIEDLEGQIRFLEGQRKDIDREIANKKAEIKMWSDRKLKEEQNNEK